MPWPFTQITHQYYYAKFTITQNTITQSLLLRKVYYYAKYYYAKVTITQSLLLRKSYYYAKFTITQKLLLRKSYYYAKYIGELKHTEEGAAPWTISIDSTKRNKY